MGIVSLIVALESCQDKSMYLDNPRGISHSTIATIDFEKSTPEANLLKQSFKEFVPELKVLTEMVSTKGSDLERTKEYSRVIYILENISFQSIEMFRSYGVTENEINEITKEYTDYQIALMGLITITFQESCRLNSGTTGSKNEIDLSYGKILDCLGRALLGVELSNFVFEFGEKIVLNTVMQIAKKAIVRSLGVIGAIVAIIDFGDCLGIYDVW